MRTSELMCSCQEQTARDQAIGRCYKLVLLVVRCLQSSYIQTLEAVSKLHFPCGTPLPIGLLQADLAKKSMMRTFWKAATPRYALHAL